ncbi:hypothetical protein [Capybara microvirus Cap1_SP_121]|nr:hypothetical protein [Capybara microvirus Cap1_SP_121]
MNKEQTTTISIELTQAEIKTIKRAKKLNADIYGKRIQFENYIKGRLMADSRMILSMWYESRAEEDWQQMIENMEKKT